MVDVVSTSEDIKEAISESLKYFPDVRDLQPEQRLIVEHVVRRKDVFAALPTGFGKSLTFQILRSVFNVLLDKGFHVPAFPLVIVVSPLSSIVFSQKISIPPPQKGLFSSPPLLWKFKLSFIHFFNFFGLTEPPTPQEILIPSVGECGYFLELHTVKDHVGLLEEP